MSRPRKNKSDYWMPPGVKLAKGRYVLRSKLTQNKEVKLCEGSATRLRVLTEYERYLNHGTGTLDWFCTEYRKSQTHNELSKATQELYRHCHNNLNKVTFNGGKKFMSLEPEQVTPGILRQILDLRAQKNAKSMGNREIKGFLSAVFTWAIQRDKMKIQYNPCRSVSRNKESPSNHYVEDWEYELALKHSDWLYNVLELAYLVYARISEVLALTRKDIKPDGIFVKRLKGSKSNIVRWSPLLKEIIENATSGTVTSPYILHKNGKRITYGMIRKPWAKMMQLAQAEREDFRPFTPHHLKAKGISDNDKPQNSAGHRSREIEEIYKRKVERVDPPK